MSEYYHIVPWYNSEEWRQVYDKIYSPTSTFATREDALNLLLVWKARCPSLPSGVESTLTLLEVHMQDLKNTDETVKEQLLRLAYSSAIMRFVNHMLDTETAKGTSLYQAAKNLGVPDWIIDLRHDTAHSNNLPSIELLREASVISLDWLQKHYWDKYSQHVQDYTSGQKEIDSCDEYKIAALMNFCISLSFCAHSKCKIRNLSGISSNSMRESIVNDARELFGDYVDLSNLKTVSILSLINIMNVQSKKMLRSKDTAVHINKALLADDALFLSLEVLNCFDNGEFKRKTELNRRYVQCFEVLLTYLHTNGFLLDFILELVKISQCEDSESYKRCLAALWVSEILKSLRKCQNFVEKVKKNNPDENWKRKDLKLLFHHWFPNEIVNALLLDLLKPVPKELMDINYIQPIISTYNPYLMYFIKDLLNLVDPLLPKVTTDKIYNLAKLISSPEMLTSTSKKIYTVDDLKNAEVMSSSVDDNDSDCLLVDKLDESEIIDNEICDQLVHSIWRVAANGIGWSTCPIGYVPHQPRGDDEDVHMMET